MTAAPGGRAEGAKKETEERRPPRKEEGGAKEEDPKPPEFLHLKTLQFKRMSDMLKKLGVK